MFRAGEDPTPIPRDPALSRHDLRSSPKGYPTLLPTERVDSRFDGQFAPHNEEANLPPPPPVPLANSFPPSAGHITPTPSLAARPNGSYPPPAMLDSDHQLSIIQIWMNAQPRIAQLRNLILSLRLDVKQERDRCTELETLFDHILDNFILVLNAATAHGFYGRYKDELDRYAENLKSLRGGLKRQREKNSRLADTLCNQEYTLTDLEGKIYQELDREFRIGLSPPTTFTSISQADTTRKSDDTSTAESTRDELYSRMGDLRVLLDRLADFEFELRQELDERDLLRGAGQMNLISDDQLFQERKVEHQELQQELEKTRADVDSLKELCTSRGIAFEDVQFANPYDESEEALTARSERLDPESTPPLAGSTILSTFLSTRDRVKKWLSEPVPEASYQTENDRPEDQASQVSLTEGWVGVKHTKQGRPSSASGKLETTEALPVLPRWNLGPAPGSHHLRPMLSDSMVEEAKHVQKRASVKTL
ncbi:hypothetical protein P154DRAFT_577364 [Amniculicola lignicola CBS 123094]|uniref:Uncharacterized protein n=1 Tax=Amniculicola lignicola CBS 123094 TaxID=1392246 RepID=A0A6A5WBC4_9PLEO|nr:hypothetical protein P154DRAFT_577364 [Amniculicola lignicola CBS 123094]